MKKGISTWLMTKVVMLIFLTLTFGIIMSFTGIVQQRALSDSAQHITGRVKTSIQALLGIRAETGSRYVVIPDEIPENSDRSTTYTVNLFKPNSNPQKLSIAIAEGTGFSSSNRPDRYISASSFNFPSGSDYNFTLGSSSGGSDEIFLSSEDINKIIIKKDGEEFILFGAK